jgi:hypothetical protein
MHTSYPRLSLPSLVAAAALFITYAQAAAAQEAPRPATVTPAAAETAAKSEATNAPAKSEAANAAAPETAPAAKDAAAAQAPAKPAPAAPDKCACEVPDEPDAAAPSAESAASPVRQLFASAAVPDRNAAPELFPRLALSDDGQTDQQHQQSGSNATQWTPLTYKQKMTRAAKNAFFSPLGVGRTLFSSALTQYNEDDQPHKTREDEFADFGTRFAINYSRRATRTLLGSGVYPILFNQDPRYDRADPDKGVVARAGHAVSRVLVQRGDGGELQPAVSRWAGSLSASALSNLWERSTPGHDRIGTDATFKRFANSFVNDAINYLFVEFWPDIAKIFKR